MGLTEVGAITIGSSGETAGVGRGGTPASGLGDRLGRRCQDTPCNAEPRVPADQAGIQSHCSGPIPPCNTTLWEGNQGSRPLAAPHPARVEGGTVLLTGAP